MRVQYCDSNDRFYGCHVEGCNLGADEVGKCESDPSLSDKCFCPRMKSLNLDEQGDVVLVDPLAHRMSIDDALGATTERIDGALKATTKRIDGRLQDVEGGGLGVFQSCTSGSSWCDGQGIQECIKSGDHRPHYCAPGYSCIQRKSHGGQGRCVKRAWNISTWIPRP